MFNNSALALFLFLGSYVLYEPGMKTEMVVFLLYCVFLGIVALGLVLFGHHPWVKKWLDRLF
ncbi:MULTISPECIES: hypothetical protein [Sulfurospirillum]|uniref:BacA superfamily protein n=4 Tax=Sulfurospirillum TaxID=57665 RepID=A0A1Y0HL17_9BACT|nr:MULTISPECIES: hypothetical protein [Sulfurospirillum]AHJ12840.1 BacA superfamily protein [Sulfurospirillum multivorans DSM 12446]AOO65316.1 BacA superfamily protein [Sulfurospirillum halorespirans DSM 13726]ARU48797.1 hypothetical protein Sdiek1_1634 [Sulfurospirillum diekertiae]ASC93618.1 hypothetical protein Sdiek2_1600 [Sulfurospirillum diekertiae]ATB69661.1 BacA superfamily protein [Sulfurospirillum diekertiae]